MIEWNNLGFVDRLPLIDVAPLLDGEGATSPAAAGCVAALDQACRESGFFAVTGHGLGHALADVLERGRAFFALDEATKELVPRANRFGFVPHRDLAIDGARLTGVTEYLDVGLDDDMGLGVEDPWPALAGFRPAVQAYQQRALTVAASVLEALAVALAVEPSFFADRMRRPQCKLRLLHYLPAGDGGPTGRPVANEAHTDYGAITLLATDGVPGLELKPRGGRWTAIETPPGAIVVNLGDLLARWTNLRYASTPHRVIAPTVDRYAIPFFVNPDPDSIVDCLPSCVTADDPCRYEPVTAGEFLAGRIDKTIPEPYEAALS